MPYQQTLVTVSRVVADSPATRLRVRGTGETGTLDIGDEILEINGTTIKTEEDFGSAVDASGRTMALKIRSSDGRVLDCNSNLNW